VNFESCPAATVPTVVSSGGVVGMAVATTVAVVEFEGSFERDFGIKRKPIRKNNAMIDTAKMRL
jgi:hypothetical protein